MIVLSRCTCGTLSVTTVTITTLWCTVRLCSTLARSASGVVSGLASRKTPVRGAREIGVGVADLLDEVAQRALAARAALGDDPRPSLPRDEHDEHDPGDRASGNQPPWTTFGRLAEKNARSTIRNAIAPVTASRFGLPHTMWTTTKNSTVSIASVPVTAIP